MVLEALLIKVKHEDHERAQEQKKKEWKSDRDHLKEFA